jgi:hypothetical protein
VIIVSFCCLCFVWSVFSSFFCSLPFQMTLSLKRVHLGRARLAHNIHYTQGWCLGSSYVVLSCLGSSYVVLFSIFNYLFLSSSICFVSLYRHSFRGESTSRLPPSRPAHTTLRFLFPHLFRSLYLFFIFYFLFVSFSLYRHSFIGQSTSRLPPSRPAHTTLRFVIRYLFRSLYLFFIFSFLFVSFSL